MYLNLAQGGIGRVGCMDDLGAGGKGGCQDNRSDAVHGCLQCVDSAVIPDTAHPEMGAGLAHRVIKPSHAPLPLHGRPLDCC